MAPPRGRGLRPGGVLRAVGRLVVLVAMGFGLGLVFGVVMEEPQLLAGHLRGESEAVQVRVRSGSERSGDSDTLRVRSEASLLAGSPGEPSRQAAIDSKSGGEGTATGTSLPAVGARPVEESSPTVTESGEPTPSDRVGVLAAGAAGAPRWAIQVGAFAEESAAGGLADSLRSRYPVVVLSGGEGRRWRVRVQPLAGEKRAREVAASLKQEEGLPTWVISLDGQAGR